MVSQSNALNHRRTYRYCHHLLECYSTYIGFEHRLEWISLDALHARWDELPLTDTQRRGFYPITLDNSYRARAIQTYTEDGSERYQIDSTAMASVTVSNITRKAG